MPLPTLKSELEAYLLSLKTRLVEVLNDDYDDYVGLSSRLVTVDGAVLRMTKPLHDIRDKLEGVEEVLRGELAALKQVVMCWGRGSA